MDGHYKDGEALLLLGDSYLLNNEKDKAEAIYKQIIEAYPKTDVAKRAEEAQKGTPANTQGAGTEESVDSGQSGESCLSDRTFSGIRMYMTIIRKQKNPMEM